MLSLYEILKASKTGIAPDMWTALAGMNWGGADSGHEVKELTGIPPLSFTADGTPLLDYLISGNMSQSGTPTPDNPIMPQGTGESTAQLYNTVETAWISGVLDDNGNYSSSTLSHYTSNFTEVNENTSYCLSGDVGDGNTVHRIYFYDNNKNWISRTPTMIFTEYAFTTPNNCKYIRVQVYNSVNDTSNWMLNLGSEALPYEPYGYKIPISSAGKTNNIYLGEVQTVRQIKKLVFTGTEEWSKGNYPPSGGYQFFTSKPSDIADIPDWLTTHFKKGSGLNGSAFASYLSLYPEKSILPENATINDFKSWLAQQYTAGTPVTVWYVLATPQTAVVNEPLRKIGNYADTVSYEQAAVQIPTIKGQNTIDVLTELKPSEIYIKYQE